MAVRMAALVRTKSGEFFARKGIPADVRDAYARLYGQRWEAQLRLPANTSKHEAKTKLGEWLAEVETRIATLRAASKGEGQPLTRLNAIALAGRWYSWFVAQHESDPGEPEKWANLSDHLVWNVLYPEAPLSFHENPQADPEWTWAKHPDVRVSVRPRIAELARTASFLADEGVVLNNDAQTLFVDAVSDNLYQALTLLQRRAEGDYRPDTTPQSFPAFIGLHVGNGQGLDCWQLFEAFVTATKPADGTVKRWRAVFLDLKREFPHSAEAITGAAARAWVGKLVTKKRSAITVKEVWIPALRRVFSWAEKQKHIRKTPFADVTVDVPKKTRGRETEAFNPEEARVILVASLKYQTPKSAFERAKRWVMWLCAYSGARAGEMTQLRGIDVQKRGSFHVMRITPEAGTTKTKETRVVPIHEHLIKQGFIEFVHSIGKGPLFYNEGRPKRSSASKDPLNPSRTPAASARARLGEWVRKLGVNDPEVSPTHGWRHTFKQTAERSGISERIHDAITGHAATTEGRKYGAPTVEDMAAALKKFPRYDLGDVSDGSKQGGSKNAARAGGVIGRKR